jgi:hypothetical protein
MIEDIEIASLHRISFEAKQNFFCRRGSFALAAAASGIVPGVALSPSDSPKFPWSEIVDEKRIWPIQYLLPGGAKIYRH